MVMNRDVFMISSLYFLYSTVVMIVMPKDPITYTIAAPAITIVSINPEFKID